MPMTGLRLLPAWFVLCGLAAGLLARASTVSSPPNSPFIVEVWDAEDGLPQSSVFSVIQTRDGYLWLGTAHGLARFDGFRFQVFDANNTPGLNSSHIVYLFEDSRTNLWIGMESAGVALAREGTVRTLEKIGNGSREGRLTSAWEDSTGAVWLFTADGKLYRHLQGNVDEWNVGGGPPGAVRGMAGEPDGLWVGPTWWNGDWWLSAIGPLATLKPPELPQRFVPLVGQLDFLISSSKGGYWRLVNRHIQKCRGDILEREFDGYPWGETPVTAVCEDLEGNLIVGTYGSGVWWYDAFGQATPLTGAEGLSHTYIWSLTVDREGSLWVGTDGGGLNCVKRRKFHVTPASKYGWTIQTACSDAEGGVWLGFQSGFGAAYAKGDVFKEFGATNGLDPNVLSVFADKSGQVWIGTGGGLFKLAGESFELMDWPGMPLAGVAAIHQDRSGQLWFGTAAGLVRWNGREPKRYTTLDALSSDAISALADDADGNLWIGTAGGGLNRLRDDKVKVFHKQAGGLPSNDVSALLVDSKGVLWVGTSGSGLARFARGQWTRFSTREGLPGNSIGFLLEDGDGDLWLGTNGGITRVRRKSLDQLGAGPEAVLNCRVYGKADGLPTRECRQGSQPAAWRAPDGTLLFATTKGLVTVNPAELQPNPVPPPVVIESAVVESQPQTTNTLRAPPPRKIIVPPGKQHLDIHYAGLNLSAASRARFRYRLAKHETVWTDAGDRRVAPYSKLPPGDYRFEVEACNEDGVWSAAPATLAIIVQPPFWLTWWFLTASSVALLAVIVGTVHLVSTQKLKRQLRQQAALEKERSRIARDLHDQLGANLTQVSLLGELVEADKHLPDEVDAHARQIMQTSRETTRALDEIVWATNPANDTLEGLINYVCKYAQEYLALAGMRYRLEVPSQLPATPLLPEVRHNVFLAVKEAVNNIVKHAQAQSAWVRLRLDSTQFTLEIQDDGRGLPAGATGSARNGLKNMRKRLEEVGGNLVIEPALEGGTIVRLVVPIQNQPL